jgi:hypothetical protein
MLWNFIFARLNSDFRNKISQDDVGIFYILGLPPFYGLQFLRTVIAAQEELYIHYVYKNGTGGP